MSRSAKANQIPLPESKQLKKMFYVFYAIHRIVLLRVQNKNGWQGIGLVPFRSVELSSHIYLAFSFRRTIQPYIFKYKRM